MAAPESHYGFEVQQTSVQNRPIFFARSRSSLVFKPFTVFAITESAYSTWTPLGEREKNFLISLLHRHLTKTVLLSLLADTDHDLPESCGYTTSINRHAKNQSHAKTVTNLPHESRLDTRYYFNVRSKAEISQLIICHTEPTTKKWKTEKLESKKGIRSAVSVNSPGNPRSQS